MSTLAPAPVPHRAHHHLPGRRHLGRLGLLLAAGAGALSYLARPSFELAVLVFACVWYVVGAGIGSVLDHPAHRRQWVVHVALYPLATIAVTGAIWILWPHPFAALLAGLLCGAGLQAAVTRLFLPGVVDDERHDMRHSVGLE